MASTSGKRKARASGRLRSGPRPRTPLAFAGLWEVWTGPNGEEVETAAIVTTPANRALRPLHDRVPVVLAPETYDAWLDCRGVDANTATALIAPPPETFFEAYEVSPAVNRTANDSPDLLTPASELPPPEPAEAGATAKPEPDEAAGVVVLSLRWPPAAMVNLSLSAHLDRLVRETQTRAFILYVLILFLTGENQNA